MLAHVFPMSIRRLVGEKRSGSRDAVVDVEVVLYGRAWAEYVVAPS